MGSRKKVENLASEWDNNTEQESKQNALDLMLFKGLFLLDLEKKESYFVLIYKNIYIYIKQVKHDVADTSSLFFS